MVHLRQQQAVAGFAERHLRYSTEYSQEGRVLRIVRMESSAVGIHPPERLADVIAFFRAISADENNHTIVIDHGGERDPPAGPPKEPYRQ
ncbi:MAG: hypothetical protein ACREIV_08115 [Planctomycetaceae bacterium]